MMMDVICDVPKNDFLGENDDNEQNEFTAKYQMQYLTRRCSFSKASVCSLGPIALYINI